jgi:hypothetical protein
MMDWNSVELAEQKHEKDVVCESSPHPDTMSLTMVLTGRSAHGSRPWYPVMVLMNIEVGLYAYTHAIIAVKLTSARFNILQRSSFWWCRDPDLVGDVRLLRRCCRARNEVSEGKEKDFAENEGRDFSMIVVITNVDYIPP